MATQRATMIFKATTTATLRTGGWSESWYMDGTPAAVSNKLLDLCALRAQGLAGTAQIAGQRIQQLGGRATSLNRIFPGRARLTVDVPQMAILCSVFNAGGIQKKIFTLRGIPDDAVVGGDFVGGGGVNTAINNFLAGLAADSWQWRARDTSIATVQVQSIGADGTFVLVADYAFNAQDTFTLVRVRDVNGHSVTGNFIVGTKTDARNGKFLAWPGRVVGVSGKVRKLSYIFPVVSNLNAQIIRGMIRKVGRPSDLYRGRASVKR